MVLCAPTLCRTTWRTKNKLKFRFVSQARSFLSSRTLKVYFIAFHSSLFLSAFVFLSFPFSVLRLIFTDYFKYRAENLFKIYFAHESEMGFTRLKKFTPVVPVQYFFSLNSTNQSIFFRLTEFYNRSSENICLFYLKYYCLKTSKLEKARRKSV